MGEEVRGGRGGRRDRQRSFDTGAAPQTAGVVCWGRSLVVSLRDDVLRFGGS